MLQNYHKLLIKFKKKIFVRSGFHSGKRLRVIDATWTGYQAYMLTHSVSRYPVSAELSEAMSIESRCLAFSNLYLLVCAERY